MRTMRTLLVFGFLLGMLTSLINAHAVRGRPTENYNSEHFSARSFSELKENSMRAMKANYEATANSELSLEAKVMLMNTEVNTRILHKTKQKYTKNGSLVHCQKHTDVL